MLDAIAGKTASSSNDTNKPHQRLKVFLLDKAQFDKHCEQAHVYIKSCHLASQREVLVALIH